MMRMMKALKLNLLMKATRRFGVSREGHAGIMLSILAMPLILAIGFVIDFTQASRYRSELQNVADAVALSAVRGLPISDLQGQIDGKSIYESLMAGMRAGLISDDLKITFEESPDFKAFVVINAVAKGMFGNDIGLGPVRYEVKAEAILSGNETEVAMVLDLSASMFTPRMRGLGFAMTAFDKAMMETAHVLERFRIAVVPFAGGVTLPVYAAKWSDDPKDFKTAEAQGRTCFAPLNSVQDIAVTPPSGQSFKLMKSYARCIPEQLFPLTENFSQFRSFANAFKNPPASRASWELQKDGPYVGTALYLGASWANRLLSEKWAPYLPVGSGARSPKKATKYVIIMTDGEQLGIEGYSRSQADQMLLTVCSNMRTTGIEIFAVGFDLDTATKAMLRQCVAKETNFLPANDPAEMKDAFERIGRIVGEASARLVY